MKTSTNLLRTILATLILCLFAAGEPIRAQEVITNASATGFGESARLIVNRSADFGLEESINLSIDGKRVAVLAYNDNYDTLVSSGRHVLSINTDPKTGLQHPKPITVTLEPGQTYTFTAVWSDSERADLVAN